MRYCYIDTSGAINAPHILPRSAKRPADGATCGNLAQLPLTELAAFGWYPYEDAPQPAHDGSTQRIDTTYSLGTDGIVRPVHTVVARPLAEARANLTRYLEQKWQAVEQGTFTHGTRKYRSDPIAVARLGVAAAKAMRSKRDALAFSIKWRDVTGSITTFDASGVEALQDALLAHGDEAHRIYADLKAKIDGGTITLESEIDAAAWPT